MAYGTFTHGGTTFPLTADLTQSLLKDADPAVYYALEYFASVIETHVGERLMAEAKAAGIRAIESPVAYLLPYEPKKYLLEQQAKFPLLAVWRASSKPGVATASFMRVEATWRVAYVLPPLSPGQLERLNPILKAVEAVLLNRIENKFDPKYRDGASVWTLAGIEEIELVAGVFGEFEPTSGANQTFPAWMGSLMVRERDRQPPDEAYDGKFAGLRATITSQAGNEAPVTVVDQVFDFVDPTTIPTIVALYQADRGVSHGTTEVSVGNWENQVSGGNPLAPTAPANQPIEAEDDETHRTVILGDGVSACIEASIPTLGADTGKTVVVAFRLWDVAARSAIALVTSTLANGTLAIEANTVGTVGQRLGVFVTGSSFDTQFATDTEWHIAVARVAASSPGSSIASSLRVQVDDQPAVLSLKSGSGLWNTMGASGFLATLGLSSDLASTSARAGIGVAMAFTSELSDADTALAVAFCKQWLRTQP